MKKPSNEFDALEKRFRSSGASIRRSVRRARRGLNAIVRFHYGATP